MDYSCFDYSLNAHSNSYNKIPVSTPMDDNVLLILFVYKHALQLQCCLQL